MANFLYRVIDDQGQETSGHMEADDHTLVKQQLRRQGLYVVELEEAREVDGNLQSDDFRQQLTELLPVTSIQKIFLFRQLGLMLRSGISITQALELMSQLESGRMRLLVMNINYRVRGGESLSNAMEHHKGVFSLLAIQMIRSAEVSGELDLALERIADYISRQAALRRQVLSAMFYPAVTLLAAIGVFIIMMVVVIPKFEEFLAQTGRQVPPSTQLLIDFGNFMHANSIILTLALIATLIGTGVAYQQKGGRIFIDHVLLRLPVIGKVIVSASMAQISWAMGMLLKTGVPIVQALRIVTSMMGNRVIAASLEAATERVIHGQNMGRSFHQPFISKLVVQLITVGETSGNIVPIMQEANTYYEGELQNRTRQLASLVEPVSILLIGSIVGFIYYGFFKAILSLSAGV